MRIMAAPYDTADHLQDGYTIVPADRFQYLWFDHDLLPQGPRLKQWIMHDRRRVNLDYFPGVRENAAADD